MTPEMKEKVICLCDATTKSNVENSDNCAAVIRELLQNFYHGNWAVFYVMAGVTNKNNV